MADSAIANFPGTRFLARRGDSANSTSTAASGSRAGAEFSKYRERPWANVVRTIFSAAAAAVLWIGWLNRDDGGLTPKSGMGYWLGVAGGALMLLLLVYPLRKRMRPLRVIGTVPFGSAPTDPRRRRMRAGLLACEFSPWLDQQQRGLGRDARRRRQRGRRSVSLRKDPSRVIWAKSGGPGDPGRRGSSRNHPGRLPVADRALGQLNALRAWRGRRGHSRRARLWPMLSWRGTRVRMRLIADARQAIAIEGRRLGQSRGHMRRQLAAVADLVTLHVVAVKKAATFGFYERLFSLWHFLHVPLFVLLVVATITHVFAAHFF